jgi:hypothetical protein
VLFHIGYFIGLGLEMVAVRKRSRDLLHGSMTDFQTPNRKRLATNRDEIELRQMSFLYPFETAPEINAGIQIENSIFISTIKRWSGVPQTKIETRLTTHD